MYVKKKRLQHKPESHYPFTHSSWCSIPPRVKGDSLYNTVAETCSPTLCLTSISLKRCSTTKACSVSADNCNQQHKLVCSNSMTFLAFSCPGWSSTRSLKCSTNYHLRLCAPLRGPGTPHPSNQPVRLGPPASRLCAGICTRLNIHTHPLFITYKLLVAGWNIFPQELL